MSIRDALEKLRTELDGFDTFLDEREKEGKFFVDIEELNAYLTGSTFYIEVDTKGYSACAEMIYERGFE